MENNVRNGKVTVLMRKMAIPQHIQGWKYVEEAVYMVIEEPKILNGITKYLYPELAKKFDTTSSRVERAIRHAIEHVMRYAPLKVLKAVFGNTIPDGYKITNSHLIAAMAQVISEEPDNPVWEM